MNQSPVNACTFEPLPKQFRSATCINMSTNYYGHHMTLDAISLMDSLHERRCLSSDVDPFASSVLACIIHDYESATSSWIEFLKALQPVLVATDAALEALETPLSSMTVASVLFKLGDADGANAALDGLKVGLPELDKSVIAGVHSIRSLCKRMQLEVGMHSESLIEQLKALQARDFPFTESVNELLCGVSSAKLMRASTFDDLLVVSASYGWQMRMLRKVRERITKCEEWVQKLGDTLSRLQGGELEEALLSVSRSDSVLILQHARASVNCTSDTLTDIFHELLVCKTEKSSE